MKVKSLLLTTFFVWFMAFGLSGQVLDITLDANQLQNPDCWLNQGNLSDNKVYVHAGACSSSSSSCTSGIAPSGSTSWEHVIGNWGMDDGLGEMTPGASGIWTFQIDVQTYFTAAGFPNGGTAHVIGLVFRSSDGSFEGKDDQCGDLFIVDVNTSSPRVIQGTTQAPFAPVTVSVATSVEEPKVARNLKLFPNPSRGQTHLSYDLNKRVDDLQVMVYNTLGQEIQELFHGSQNPGPQELSWETDQAGLYFVVLKKDGKAVLSEKVLVQ